MKKSFLVSLDLLAGAHPARVYADTPAKAAELAAPILADYGDTPSVVVVRVHDESTDETWRVKAQVEPAYEVVYLPELTKEEIAGRVALCGGPQLA